MSKVVVFHPGVQHSWQTARALQELGLLEYYATSLFYKPDEWPYRLERLPGPLGKRLASEFRRFANPALDPALVHSAPTIELLERLASRANLRKLAAKIDRWGNDHFVKYLAPDIRSDRPFALWGYNNSSYTTFAAAGASGRAKVLDQTIGHPRFFEAILHEQFDQHPEWFTAPPSPPDEDLSQRNDAEIALADHIVVGSAFCGQTLVDHSGIDGLAEKLTVLPYCFDPANFTAPLRPPRPASEPLRVLFIGQVGVRKGTHLLIEAFAQIPASAATLTLVGPMLLPPETFARHACAGPIRHVPTVPRSEVARIMAAHDVLILPSFYEGSAIVLLEALASHLGIIQSRAAGNGATAQTGKVLDHVSIPAIRAAILEAASDRLRVEAWRAAARAEAERYTFDRYRDGIVAVLAKLG